MLHMTPQFPQCEESTWKLVQIVLPATVHALGTAPPQVHTPATQVWPAMHLVPQPPQSLDWVMKLVQYCMPAPLLHTLGSTAEQLCTHKPDEQRVPAPHTVAQLPQWLGSVWKLVQNALGPLPHELGDEAGQVHIELTHAMPAGHAMPHALQLSASSVRSAQYFPPAPLVQMV
jgi:hypothetical protein